MKRLFAVIATSFFAAGVGANDVYGDFGDGNADLSDQHRPQNHVTAVQPSIGDSFDRYQGWADGNGDLFRSSAAGIADPTMSEHQLPDVYRDFGDDPDL